MSLTATAVTIALMVSLLPLSLIARHDPKRLRSITDAGVAPHRGRTRQWLAACTLLPGVVLIGLSDWPAFLIWLGALVALGWALVQLLAARR